MGDGAGVMIFWLIVVVGYFLPTVISVARSANATAAIIALDLLTGWTVIGWLIALIWSMAGETEAQVRARDAYYANATTGRR